MDLLELHNKALQSPLDPAELDWLKGMAEKYPYLNTIQATFARNAQLNRLPNARQIRSLASVLAPNRQYLADYLEAALKPVSTEILPVVNGEQNTLSVSTERVDTQSVPAPEASVAETETLTPPSSFAEATLTAIPEVQLDWKLQTMLQLRIGMYLPLAAVIAQEIKSFPQATQQSTLPPAVESKKKLPQSEPEVDTPKQKPTVVEDIAPKSIKQADENQGKLTDRPTSSELTQEIISAPLSGFFPPPDEVDRQSLLQRIQAQISEGVTEQKPQQKQDVSFPTEEEIYGETGSRQSPEDEERESLRQLRQSLQQMLIKPEEGGKNLDPAVISLDTLPTALTAGQDNRSTLPEVTSENRLLKDPVPTLPVVEAEVEKIKESVPDIMAPQEVILKKDVPAESEEKPSGEKSFSRFIQPDFDQKPIAVVQPKAETIELLQDEKPKPEKTDEVTPQAEVMDSVKMRIRQVTESMKRFVEPEFDARLGRKNTLDPSPSRQLETTISHKTEDKTLDITARKDEEVKSEFIGENSMKRFVAPDFNSTSAEVTKLIPVESENVKVVDAENSMTRFVSPSFDVKPETLHLERENKRKIEAETVTPEPITTAEAENVISSSEITIQKTEVFTDESIPDRSASMQRFVEPSFNLTSTVNSKSEIKLETEVKPTTVESTLTSAPKELLRALENIEPVSGERVTSDSMKRFIEPSFAAIIPESKATINRISESEIGSSTDTSPAVTDRTPKADTTLPKKDESDTSDSFRRFVQPEFIPKPPELSLYRQYEKEEALAETESTNSKINGEVFTYTEGENQEGLSLKPDRIKFFTDSDAEPKAGLKEEDSVAKALSNITAKLTRQPFAKDDSEVKIDALGTLSEPQPSLDEETWTQLERSFLDAKIGDTEVREAKIKSSEPYTVEVQEPQILEPASLESITSAESSIVPEKDFAKRIGSFRENLNKMKSRVTPVSPESSLKVIQKRFLDSVIHTMMEDKEAAASDDIINELSLSEPITEQGFGSSNIDEVITRYGQLQPVIQSSMAVLRDSHAGQRTAPEPEPGEEKELIPETEVVSETLARIHLAQGNIGKARQLYEKLALKYPEKSSYFAEQINKLPS